MTASYLGVVGQDTCLAAAVANAGRAEQARNNVYRPLGAHGLDCPGDWSAALNAGFCKLQGRHESRRSTPRPKDKESKTPNRRRAQFKDCFCAVLNHSIEVHEVNKPDVQRLLLCCAQP